IWRWQLSCLPTTASHNQKHPLVLAQEGIATWYSCGPTVYDHAYLGNPLSKYFFNYTKMKSPMSDLTSSRWFYPGSLALMSSMSWSSDIDDKIIRRALEVGLLYL
uniref:Uncharacterized protein n=1 Tax=Salmo trutta TaxID=8032 RepID=A0A673WFC7_SALTR